MNILRHSGQPSIQLSPGKITSDLPACGLSRMASSSVRIEVRACLNPANKIMLLAFALIATSAWHETVYAGELGRLFYTPQQRQQLEFQETTNSTEDGGHRNYIIVNGVVQKRGGKRTVWINGSAQAAESANDRTPGTVPVTVPGKSRPVQLKVGQRLMLDTPSQNAPEEDK